MGECKTRLLDPCRNRYPFCIVWTPIPLLSWLFPFIGHMGIATAAGVIRDFAGPYYVSEDRMGFGNPTKYWQLNMEKVGGGEAAYDRAVSSSSEEYQKRMHNLCCDNCHSHVALALNTMAYDGRTNWNMVSILLLFLVNSSYVNVRGFLKTWLPFGIIVALIVIAIVFVK